MDSSLSNRRMIFDHTRALWGEKKGVWCAMDIESYEYEHATLTEFGWAIQRWENGEPVQEHGHLCVKENWRLRNRKYVPDAREVRSCLSEMSSQTVLTALRQKYDFGASEIIPRSDFKARIRALIESLNQYGAVYLVFHDADGDIKYVKLISISSEV